MGKSKAKKFLRENWDDDGEVRIQCKECDNQHDEVLGLPPNWTEIEWMRSFERATAECDTGRPNNWGDSVMDWQTHLGLCPDCQAEGN